MIAAGSLFTSCVENTEPQGIRDLREAKADYIESLAKLNAANEKLVAAEAAYKEAETAVKNAEVAVVEAQAAKEQAIAAQEQAKVEIIKAQIALQEIKNAEAQAKLAKQIALDSLEVAKELLKAANFEVYSKAELEKQIKSFEAEIKGYEAKIAEAEAKIRTEKDKIAQAEAKAQKDALDLEKALVEKEAALLRAKHALEQQEAAYLAFLAEVELRSYQLSPAEKSAVKEYKDAYTAVIAAKQKVRKVEELVFENDTEIEKKYADSLATLQNKVTGAKVAIEFYTAQIADVEARLANLPDSGKTAEEVAALEAEYKEQLKNLEYELANVKNEYLTYKKTQLGEPVIAYATELGEWVAKNATLPAPFNMHFKAELPDNGAVSNLFATSVQKFYQGVTNPPVQVADGYIVANFKTSTDALDGVYALDSIIDAISRKYIIDNVGLDLDTVGLVAAVKDAQDEYDAIADTLTDGLGKYKPFVDAQDSVKKAIEDTTKAFSTYREALANRRAAKKEADTANIIVAAAEDTLGKYMAVNGPWEKAKKDSTDAGAAYKTAKTKLAEAVKDTIEKKHTYDSLVDLNTNLKDKVAEAAGKEKETEGKLVAAKEDQKAADAEVQDVIKKIQDAAGDTKKVDSLNTVLKEKQALAEAAKNKVKTCTTAYNNAKTYYAFLKDINPEDLAENVKQAKTEYDDAVKNYTEVEKKEKEAKTKLGKAHTKYLAAVKDTVDLTEAFKKAQNDTATANKALADAKKAYKQAVKDTVAADNFLVRATNVIYPEAKDKFYGIYERFWGKELTDADFNEDGFLEDSIKIAPKEFVDIFVKDGGKDIVKFNPTYGYNHGSDSKFIEPATGIKLVDNKEIEIIMDRLDKDYKVKFDNTLLYTLFAKQQAAEDIFAKVGTIDNDKALAALTKIKEDLADAFVAAGQKQEEASKPFFEFVQNLVGEEFLNSVFARIDKAIAKYSEFIDEEITPSYSSIIAKAIAQGKTDSKQVFTYWFEYICCNVYDGDKYENLQIADAFAGEEIRQLISDIFAAQIENNDEYKVAKDRDNSFENLLFAAVDLTEVEEYPDITGKFIDLVFDPIVMSYIVKDFGGKIAELQEKHFAEWRAEWTAYQEKLTAVQTKIDAIKALQGVLGGYTNDPAIKDLITKENFSNGFIGIMKVNLEIAEFALAEAQKALDAFVAGPDIYEQHKTEHLADVLAKAQNDLSVAEKRLEVATAAYNKVLESHNIAE